MTRKSLTILLALAFFFLFPSFALADGVFVWPVEGEILRSYAKNQHRGIDIKAEEGAPVIAAASGKVIYARYVEGSESSLDHTISIQYNGEDLRTTYLQVKELKVKKGDEVKQGQEIAIVGKSSDSVTTVSHLHFGIKYGSDNYQNPLDFLPPLALSEAKEEVEEGSIIAPTVNPEASTEVAPESTSGLELSPVYSSAQQGVESEEEESGNSYTSASHSEVMAPAVHESPQPGEIRGKSSSSELSPPVSVETSSVQKQEGYQATRKQTTVSSSTSYDLHPVMSIPVKTSSTQEAKSNQTVGESGVISKSSNPNLASTFNSNTINDNTSKSISADVPNQFYKVKAKQLEALAVEPCSQLRLSDKQKVKYGIEDKGGFAMQTSLKAQFAYISRLLLYLILFFSLLRLAFLPRQRWGPPAYL